MASGPPFPPPYDPSPSAYGGPPAPIPGEYGWLAPASLPAQPGMPSGGPGRAPIYDLRPLSTGEVLDRTFSLYRSRFLMFAGIASLSATVQLLGQAVQLIVQHMLVRRQSSAALQITSNTLSFAVLAVFLLAFAITQAATVWAMGEVYLGHAATVTSSLRATAKGWLRYLGIALWQMASMFWPPLAVGLLFLGIWAMNGRSLGAGWIALLVLLMMCAFVAGFILYLRNLLAVPATVRESLKVRASMRRSKVLSAGGKGKLFLVLLIAGALYMVIAVIMGIMVGVATVMHHGDPQRAMYSIQIIALAIGFVGYTLISPVVMIGTTLVYFDQRVRKEAFDVAVLLGDDTAGMPGFAATPGYAANASPVAEPSVRDFPRMEQTVAEQTAVQSKAEQSAAEQPVVEPEGGASGL